MSADALRLKLPDTRATEALGIALARAFSAAGLRAGAGAGGVAWSGAVVHLRGELGSGKTTCARSLLHAVGVTAPVRSPTYTLVDTHNVGELTCVHVDLYRLQTLIEVDELGLRDLLGPGYLMLIEWPEKGGSAVPAADLSVMLDYAGEARSATLAATSDVGARWLTMLAIDSSLKPYVSNLT